MALPTRSARRHDRSQFLELQEACGHGLAGAARQVVDGCMRSCGAACSSCCVGTPHSRRRRDAPCRDRRRRSLGGRIRADLAPAVPAPRISQRRRQAPSGHPTEAARSGAGGEAESMARPRQGPPRDTGRGAWPSLERGHLFVSRRRLAPCECTRGDDRKIGLGRAGGGRFLDRVERCFAHHKTRSTCDRLPSMMQNSAGRFSSVSRFTTSSGRAAQSVRNTRSTS